MKTLSQAATLAAVMIWLSAGVHQADAAIVRVEASAVDASDNTYTLFGYFNDATDLFTARESLSRRGGGPSATYVREIVSPPVQIFAGDPTLGIPDTYQVAFAQTNFYYGAYSLYGPDLFDVFAYTPLGLGSGRLSIATTFSPVPLPSSAGVLGAGLLVLGAARFVLKRTTLAPT